MAAVNIPLKYPLVAVITPTFIPFVVSLPFPNTSSKVEEEVPPVNAVLAILTQPSPL